MERLSALDAFFLFIEDGTSHMHIATCAIFEGPAPPYRLVTTLIADRLESVPRYRQVVRFVPLQLGRPVWIDDPHFRLEYHVRHAALPAPGGTEELRDLMGRLMSQELDRHRPLWEAWMVEGLENGRWALIMKVHHCMADGISGNDLFTVLLDRESDASSADHGVWRPAPEPSALHLAADALWQLVLSPYDELLVVCRGTIAAPIRVMCRLRDVAEGMFSYARRVPPTGSNSLVGTIGPHRRWTSASATLDDVKTIRQAFGATVNDVIVTAITGGLRALLLSRGESAHGVVLRTLIPVSVRPEGAHDTYDNRVSAMFADLPVDIDDPVDRLLAVREQMAMLKASHQTAAGEGLTALAGLAPPVALAFAERAAMQILRRLPQHTINTVTTNVAGPQHPLQLAGRRMIEYLPFVPIVYGMRVGMAVLSYDGKLAFGLTSDYDAADDIDVLANGIEDTIAELLKLAT
jgi:diacylglycerol O-acyltransferase / wax synthase